MREVHISDERKPQVVFYDIELDDAKLDPYAHRVYCRIARRCAGALAGYCSESIASIADACSMSPKSVTRAFRVLIERRMIRRDHRDGQASLYVLTDKSTWIPFDKWQDMASGNRSETGQSEDTRVSQTGVGGSHRPRYPGLTDLGVGLTDLGGGSHRPTMKKNIDTKKKTREEDAPAAPSSTDEYLGNSINNALEDLYPGYATNWKTMSNLVALARRFEASPSDIEAFPAWLAENHPKKGNTVFAFLDFFADCVKSRREKPSPTRQAQRAPDWYVEAYNAVS